MLYSANRLAWESRTLRCVDDFTMSITPPKAGGIRLCIHIDGCEATTFELRAENDDLMKLKAWMEELVRSECAEAALSNGQRLAYRVTDVPESTVEPTVRFLDELFPSPIGILTLTPAAGEALECVVKVKHFLNALYLYLLTGGYADSILPYGKRFSKEWYPFTHTPSPGYQGTSKSLWHYNQLQSPLIEWYLCTAASYNEVRPNFKWIPDIRDVIRMQADWDIDMLFWKGWRESAGEVSYIEIGPYHFDLSDVPALVQWGDAFRKMQIPLPEVVSGEEDKAPHRTLTQDGKAWQIQGYHLAQQVCRRLPLNVALIYELTYEIAYDTPVWSRDIGHVIFDPRILKQ